MNHRPKRAIRWRRLGAATVVGALLLGCGSDDAGDAEPVSTGGEEPDSTEPGTTEPPAPEEPALKAAPDCLHDPTTVLVAVDETNDPANVAEKISGTVDGFDGEDAFGEPLEGDALRAKFDLPADVADDVIDIVSQRLLVYSVVGDPEGDRSGAIQLAVALKEVGYAASPLLAVGFAGHWGFAPGSGATQVTDASPMYDDVTVPPGNPIVVIDTGYVDTSADDGVPAVPDVTAASEFDREDRYASVPEAYRGHATFIASLLRQEIPAPVVQYRLPATPATLMETSSGEELDDAGGVFQHDGKELLLSDELQFLATTVRARFGTKPAFADQPFVLNVSSGAYPCGTVDRADLGAVAARLAVEYWTGGGEQQLEPCRVVVASAGNGGTTGTFVPSDYPDVVGVVASERRADTTLRAAFSNDGNVRAPGVELVGHRGADEVVAWSGTSFAAPVVAANLARSSSCDDLRQLGTADDAEVSIETDKVRVAASAGG